MCPIWPLRQFCPVTSCRADCLSLDLVLRLVAQNRCNKLCVTLNRLCRILVPTTQLIDMKSQSETVKGLLYFDRSVRAELASKTHSGQQL